MHSNKLKQTQIHVIDSWDNFQKLVTGPTYRSWAFRGHERSEWSLYSTLSRRFIDFGVHEEAWAHQEDRIFRIFCRKAHLFLKHVPKKDRAFEWLSIMQNHGAPTRLLDFTWSPFVAAFFALEKAETDSAVWSVNFAKLGSARHVFPPEQELRPPPGPRTRKKYDRYFVNNEVPFLAAGEPYNMSQRLIAQSGTFLVPGVLGQPVESIVSSYPHPEDTIAKFILKTSRIRDEAMRSLYYMNITYATLFPGLDGMARSLNYELEFHWALDPKTGRVDPSFDRAESDSE